MHDTQPQGSAAASLGAHSKDSQPQARQGTQDDHGGQGSWQQAGASLAGQAREGVERVAAGVRDMAATARDTVATQGSHAMESTGRMVRDQPMMALAVTGIACFALGMMIGRGRY